ADSPAYEMPGTVQARFVADAFVRLGGYYLTGIPNSNTKPEVVRAYRVFDYAAQYFADRDAQPHVRRLYLKRQGGSNDTMQAMPWLAFAADKRQYQAQAVFGALLFKGEYVLRDAARGLMWLMLARDAASLEETWITDQYARAWEQAIPDERTRALDLLKRWIEQSRGGRRDQS